MLDFKELSKDGNDLELLIREILLTKGYRVHWSGKGPDGGKDLLCFEERDSEFLADVKTWLIQCKHKAHGGGSIGIGDLDDIVDSCNHHKAKGYLLVTSTYPSSKVIERLDGISAYPKNEIEATYWDAVKIEQVLSTPKLWRIAQRFFPVSSKNSTWEIYATESPNHYIANYRGYHFHLSNRIGSRVDYHFPNIDDRINEIESIKLPKDHFIRIRAVYFDDKGGNYVWFLDYMHPHDQKPHTSSAAIAHVLGDGRALDNGQLYFYDVITRPYLQHSDHYDKDHYDYYSPHLKSYQIGMHRELNFEKRSESWAAKLALEDNYEKFKSHVFQALTNSFKTINCARLLRSENAQIEKLDKFNNLRDWSEIIEKIELNDDRFFSSHFIFSVSDEKDFLSMIGFFPQELPSTFRLTNVIICTPDFGTGGSKINIEDKSVFELTLSIFPATINNSYLGRKQINQYMNEINEGVKKYKNRVEKSRKLL